MSKAISLQRIQAAARSSFSWRKGKLLAGQVLVGILFLALSLAFLIPFYWMVISSFKPVEDIFSLGFQLIPKRVTLAAYSELFATKPYLRWFWNTLFMTAMHTVATLLIAAMAGYALAKYRFRGANAVFLTILASTMIPLHLKLIPLFLTLNAYRLINTYTGVVLPTLANSFAVFFMRQFMLSIDSDLLDAARIDGASEFRLFWNIALPLSKPALTHARGPGGAGLLERPPVAAGRHAHPGHVPAFGGTGKPDVDVPAPVPPPDVGFVPLGAADHRGLLLRSPHLYPGPCDLFRAERLGA